MDKPLRWISFDYPSAGAVVEILAGPAVVISATGRNGVTFHDAVGTSQPTSSSRFSFGSVHADGVRVDNGVVAANATAGYEGVLYYRLPEDYV